MNPLSLRRPLLPLACLMTLTVWFAPASADSVMVDQVASQVADRSVEPAVEQGWPTLRLIELFTSHGCSSCPSADRLLGDMLQEDESLLALEYHVDYWNNLVHGSDGSWTDPFSSAAFTERQRLYQAAALSGSPGVYTPQAVVNGRYAVVGSDERRLRQALNRRVTAPVSIHFEAVASDSQSGREELLVSVHGEADQLSSLQGADIVLIRYIDQTRTQVRGGENNRRELINHHVVFDRTSLGQLGSQSPVQYRFEAPGHGEGCLVMLQNAALTPVIGAAECP